MTLIFAFRLLGHLYAAESLVLLNRLNEAIPHLHPDNVSQLSNSTTNDDQETSAPVQGKLSCYVVLLIRVIAVLAQFTN